jgi:hypothetical protein
LWAAYTVSAVGTGLAFDALPLVAILLLNAGPAEVAALAAAGRAAGAVLAAPLGPWVEARGKRPVMVAMDLLRAAALLSVPVAALAGRLGMAQLVVVAVLAAAADHAFRAAAGAYLKSVVAPGDLLGANSRFEATTWTTTALGPPLGGVLVGLFGPLVTVLADATSFLLSALGLRAIGGPDARPAPLDKNGTGPAELLAGWRHILTDPVLRPLFVNTTLVNGLILAAAPPLAVPGRLPAGRPAGRPVRPAPGAAHRGRPARVLAGRAGLRRAGNLGVTARLRRRAGTDHLHRRLQPGAGHHPPGAHAHRPAGPHAGRVVGHQRAGRRGPDRADRAAGRGRRDPDGDRGRRAGAAGDAAAAAARSARRHARRLIPHAAARHRR